MEEEDEDSKDRRQILAAFGTLNKKTLTNSLEETASAVTTATATVTVRKQTSSDSTEACSSISTAQYSDRSFISKTSMFSSSSSQEEGEAAAQRTVTSGQYLVAARAETARSMESLRPRADAPAPARPGSSCTGSTGSACARAHRTSFLTASERDVRESRGLPARRALSGEDMGASAEKRRGLFASTDRRALQQLSLPPPERRLTILSPHSPMATTELLWPTPSGIRGRRKKGMVLPKLILPRADSDVSDVFFERCIFSFYPCSFLLSTMSFYLASVSFRKY